MLQTRPSALNSSVPASRPRSASPPTLNPTSTSSTAISLPALTVTAISPLPPISPQPPFSPQPSTSTQPPTSALPPTSPQPSSHNAISSSVNASSTNQVGKPDPAVLCCEGPFSYEKKKLLLEVGPCQPTAEDLPSGSFPRTGKRSFRPQWYNKRLPDGTQERREWMSYSVSKDKVFCLTCMLYAKHPEQAWTSKGFSTWGRAYGSFIHHETSSAHVEALILQTEEQHVLPLLPSQLEGRRKMVEFNRLVLKQLLEILLYLARHCLAFRGHREAGWGEELHGNFKDLVILMSKYSPTLATYIDSLRKKKKA